MNHSLDYPFQLEAGPARKGDDLEPWQKFLQERCPEPKAEPRQ